MSQHGETVLIIDDDQALLDATARTLTLAGYKALTARDAVSGENLLKDRFIDTVLLDLQLPGVEGLEALEKLHADYPALPIVMITGYGSIPIAVQATRAGAFDFLQKPVDRDRLLVAVRNACERTRLERERRLLLDSLQEQYPILGDSQAIQTLKYKLNRVAQTDEPVLLVGETGTGKESAARAVHSGSRRAARSFIAVNCAAVSRELIESELFGHKRGAFTGALNDKIGKFRAADGGTIFLDEVGDMESGLQAKILRALQEKEIEPVGGTMPEKVDVRVIAATNRDLQTLVQEGKFRSDLYYRLGGVIIMLPSLRDHVDDIPVLLQLFLARRANDFNIQVPLIQPSAFEALMRYAWPGNVRELDHFAGWIMSLGGPEISSRDVAQWLGQMNSNVTAEDSVSGYRQEKENFDREYFSRLLKAYDGNITAVSRHAGLDRAGLYRKLKSLGLVDASLQ